MQKLLASNNSGLDTDQLQSLIDQVVAADRALAQTAIDEATGDVSGAVAELSLGDDLDVQDNPVGAIYAYKKAWKLATGG